MRRKQWMWLVLLAVMLVVTMVPTTALAEETAGGRFILVAEAGGSLVIAPEYISYSAGQTIGDALEKSGHTFTGLGSGQVTAIDDVVGNYTRSDQNGGYDLTTAASSVTHYCFSERFSSESKPTGGFLKLMTAMADYREKTPDVQKAAKAAYDAAWTSFAIAITDGENAETLAYELNQAVANYESTLNGVKYPVMFTDGSNPYSLHVYPGVTICAVNAYGKQWEGDRDGKLELPKGTYSFRIAHNGLSVSGNLTVSQATSVTAKLPTEEWLKLDDSFCLSGSYGEKTFTDAKFEHGDWDGRTLTVPVLDSFVGTIYTHAEHVDLPTTPTLTAIYTMKNATRNEMEKNLAFNSWNSGANSVLAKGAEGNTVIYRVSLAQDGYLYSQDYTVIFERCPTLESISVLGTEDGKTWIDQASTETFDGNATSYDYKILNTVKQVSIEAVPLVAGYEVTVNGQKADGPVTVDISGNTKVLLTVSANGYSNTYTLNIQPGAGSVMTFVSEKAVDIKVVNSNGVVMPYSAYLGTDKLNRYKYTLVPGEPYSYIATYNTHYHIADEFELSEIANSQIKIDFRKTQDWLTELAFGNSESINEKNKLPLDTEFTPSRHNYRVTYMDTEYLPYIRVKSEEDVKIQAIFTQLFSAQVYHGKQKQVELTSGHPEGMPLERFLMYQNPIENTVTIRLSKSIDGVLHYQDYLVDFQRKLTLQGMTAKCDGSAAVLLRSDGKKGFKPAETEYSVKVSLAAMNLTLNLTRYTENRCYGEEQVGYRVVVDGTDVTEAGFATIPLDGTLNTQTVSVTVKNPKAPAGSTTYRIHILKSPPVKTKFTLSPGEALLNIRETLSGERLWPDAEGCYQLCEGYSYAYALTRYGYISKSGTLKVTRNADKKLVIQDGGDETEVTEQDSGGQATIAWTLTKAAENPNIDPRISSEWPDFRGNHKNGDQTDNDNNAVTDVRLPVYAEEGTLYWATRLGKGTDSGAVGSPILVNGDLITYAADKLYRVDPVTGAIKATGTMDHTSSFSITPPTYAEGMVFVALSDGCVQAFNAQNLESLWIYREPVEIGGQPNCPVMVENGYLYTGFWNSETAEARFVCLPITDEDPGRPDEEKCASWFYTAKGGFYWAGAYVTEDYVLVGTDDGTAFCNGPSSRLLLLDAKTGKLLDSWDNLDGDIRSSVVYDSATDACYFTAKGGSFYSVRISGAGKLIDKWSVKLKNSVGGIPMSTSSPVVHNGRAYIGVSGAGQFSAYSGHNITVIDVAKRSIAYTVPTQGYPQTSGLLTTAYDAGTQTVCVYFFDNYTPGKLRVLRDKPGQTGPDLTTKEEDFSTAYALFTPLGEHAQYAICSPIVDDNGTVYFKNDSGYLMAFGSAITGLTVSGEFKTQYIAGEKFDPTGMVVTATCANGKTRDVTSYVTCPQKDANQNMIYVPCHEKILTEEDANLTISFSHVLYHNQSNGTEMDAGISTNFPNVNIGLTIIPGVLGDVDCNGEINPDDVQLLLDCEAQVKNQQLIPAVSDVSGDKVIDSNDAVLIAKYLAGEITVFPAAENNAGE